jgi:hypothetical protein
MTRYEELAELAIRYSKGFHDNQRKCQQFAGTFFRGYAKFLECPPGKSRFIAVTKTLEADLEQEGSSCEGCYGPDGFWYHAFRFDYEGTPYISTEAIRAGFKVEGSDFVVRLVNDHHIRGDRVIDDCQDIYRLLFEETKKDYESGLASGPVRKIGFACGTASPKSWGT